MRNFFTLLLVHFALFSSEGLTYMHLKLLGVHLIEVDPDFYEIKPVKALDNGIGRESVLSIATRYGASACVNGSFFEMGGCYDGCASGALKIGEWYAISSKTRGCIGWREGDQTPEMDRLWVTIEGSYDQQSIPIEGLNRGRKEGEMILFSPCFHRTTLTHRDGEEVIIVDGVIEKIVRGGSSKIPENGYVLSIQEKHPLFGTFEVGKPFSVSVQVNAQNASDKWDSCDYIVGGTPLLLYEGSKIVDFTPERTIPTFLTNRHARTAVGILPNGHWVFVVVDRTKLFDGMTMNELSDFMESLGCISALNLDGGGSSTMVYEGEIKNEPHGDQEEGKGQKMVRQVSDAIILIDKKKLSFSIRGC